MIYYNQKCDKRYISFYFKLIEKCQKNPNGINYDIF